VKNRLLDPKRTLARKLDEAWLATLVEWRYPKERILEAYLNEIYLGQRGALTIRGVGAGARSLFRKEVHQLTLAESALLAGMLRAPNTYSPTVNPTRARERRDVVIGRMRELGFISAADAERALNRSTFDVLLIDLRLRDARGDVLFRSAVERDKSYRERTLFMTGDITAEAERIIAATNCPYLRKPFDITLAVQAIAALVGIAYHANDEPPPPAGPTLGIRE
jgi:membrane peptidoglycan carboxypeptidase